MTDKPKQEPGGTKKKVTTLGDFHLKKRLGKGGMGEVFLARQISLDRPVALKTLSKELSQQPDFVARFQREARSMAKIDHGNVVKVYAVDSVKNIHFVAIEYVDGRSVQDWLDKEGRFSITDSVHIAMVCAEALRHAHDRNMVHRDIKPDNILLTSKGVVKVADFGLAKVMDDDVSMTQSGTGLGTPLYMAPEQARSAKHVDQRCDIYALGATLYHLITGKLPFEGGSTLELIIAKEKGKYTPAKQVRSEIPDRLDLIIDKMMAREPAHRYTTCEEIIRDLGSLGLHDQPLSFIDGAEPPRGLTRATSPTMSGLGSTLAGTGTGTLTGRGSAGPASSKSGRTWYVQYNTSDGKPMMEKLSTRRVIKMINAGVITPKARAKASSDGSYLPVAQFPEFSDAIERQLARKTATGRAEDIQSLYKNVEKAEKSRLRWRWVKNKARGLVGTVGLLVWIFAIGLLVIAAYFGGMWAFHWAGDTFSKMYNEDIQQRGSIQDKAPQKD